MLRRADPERGRGRGPDAGLDRLRRRLPVRHRAGAAGLRPPARGQDLAGAHPAARRRPGPADRLDLPQPWRPRRLRRGLRPRGGAVPLLRRGPRPLRPRRLRPPRDHPQHPAALLRDLRGGPGGAAADGLPGDAGGGARLGPVGPRARPRLRAARRRHPGPHGHRQRRPRPGPAAPRRRRRQAELRRLLLRLVPGRHLRQPVPQQGPRAGGRRRPGPGRLDHRPRRPGAHAAVLDPAAQRQRAPGRASRSSSASATPAPPTAPSRRATPGTASPSSPSGCWRSPSSSPTARAAPSRSPTPT